MTINRTLQLPATQYYRDVVKKTQLYLHHTVGGSAASTFKHWLNPEHVATAFIIDRDGTIYEVFDPHYWAHHLGLKVPQNTQCNKQSIGAELASEGALRAGAELNNMLVKHGQQGRFDPEWLYAFDIDPMKDVAPSGWFKGAKKLYHRFDDDDKFWSEILPYRGYMFFDKYDAPQLKALYELVSYILDEFPTIPRALIPGERDRFQQDLAWMFKGILGHANVRADKSDPNNMFAWAELEQLMMKSFTTSA